MEHELSQLVHPVFLAANEDTGWFQLLVFVIVAVFYALAGIARSRAQQKQQKPATKAPHSKPPGFTPSSTRPSPPAQRSVPVATVHSARLPKLEPAVHAYDQPKPATPKKAKHVAPAPAAPNPHPPRRVAKTQPKKLSPEKRQRILDLHDKAKLRRALIHYEVLGPCIALRDDEQLPSYAVPMSDRTLKPPDSKRR